ncbi:TPA: hypothetical protein DEP58_01745 [Patescibacteria group bacterium]|nr:hypothetical protein [Patescibacteria group bacterium]
MIWSRLKNYKCPKCNALLQDSGQLHTCTKCTFSINKQKFEEIITGKNKKYVEPNRADWEFIEN